jgi:hypothetical protein
MTGIAFRDHDDPDDRFCSLLTQEAGRAQRLPGSSPTPQGWLLTVATDDAV